MNIKRQATLLFLLLLLIWSPFRAGAQSQTSEGSQQFADLGDLPLRSGATIHDFRIGYRTLGKLNAEKSNAILWPTWLGGKSQTLLQFIGPGKVVDSDKYFVILVDSFGNGVSTSPSNNRTQMGMRFPKFTILDMVESEYQLVTQALHLTHLHAVMGVSMGGMQTFGWILTHPDFMDVAVPINGSPVSTSYDKLLWNAEIDALELDPAWNHGNPRGPLTRGAALAEEIDSMNSTTPAYRAAHTNAKEFDVFLGELKANAKTSGGAAWDQIRQREAIIALDLPSELRMTMEQAAKGIHAKLLVIVALEDHMVNPRPAVEFAAAANAPVVGLDSSCGHLSLTCLSLGPTVARFLADPASVHSETFHDTASP